MVVQKLETHRFVFQRRLSNGQLPKLIRSIPERLTCSLKRFRNLSAERTRATKVLRPIRPPALASKINSN